jgi:hypothetical protein
MLALLIFKTYLHIYYFMVLLHWFVAISNKDWRVRVFIRNITFNPIYEIPRQISSFIALIVRATLVNTTQILNIGIFLDNSYRRTRIPWLCVYLIKNNVPLCVINLNNTLTFRWFLMIRCSVTNYFDFLILDFIIKNLIFRFRELAEIYFNIANCNIPWKCLVVLKLLWNNYLWNWTQDIRFFKRNEAKCELSTNSWFNYWFWSWVIGLIADIMSTC